MSHLVLFLLFGASVLSSSEGENSTVKHRSERFLPLIFKFNHAPRKIHNPSHSNSLTIQTCQSLCQKGWISYKGRCYMLIEERMTWTQAEKICWTKRAGGHLTSITSAAENEFLYKLAQRQKETQFWIGGTYQKGLSLEWTDGSLTTFIQRPLSSLLRAVGKLFNNLLKIKFCLTLNTEGQGEWGSSLCSKRLPFICIYKPDPTHP
ncbi:snaclec coagulation factor IX-binding protein subunit A-like [Rhea pennata]|uniref:snaclec coagulation factor IX-binding protein subunit A-like n=1 Tax=Rhea pennata TaxID=8795 RepID=UPI002E2613AA